MANVVEILAVSGNYDDQNYKINLMQLGVIMKQMEQALNEDNTKELDRLKDELGRRLN